MKPYFEIDYHSFLQSKTMFCEPSGFKVDVNDLNPMLFDWQKILVQWALYKGRAAIFADCGLGKTPMQLEWANQIHKRTGKNILILAPLAVSQQTQREGEKFGISVNVCKTDDDLKSGINITNYERLHYFDPSFFIGVVLDESSILKNFAGKIRNQIIETFLNIPYKITCTATPSPNDYMELGNHSEFLGIMTRKEMLSMFFINDSGDTGKWRLKGHVKNNVFWEWLCSWAVMMKKPSDIGFNDNGFILPPINIQEVVIPYNCSINEFLFVREAQTLAERREARKETLIDRVNKAAEIINKSNNIWLVWCNLNAESNALTKVINNAIEVKGSDSVEHKESAMLAFQNNNIKCLVTKPRIAGFGMNWQNCHNMIFVGLSDSYEQFYQALRRCWRFGQAKPVNAYIIVGEKEGAVVSNIKRKENDMNIMFNSMIKYMENFTKQKLQHTTKTHTQYNPMTEMVLPNFLEVNS